MAQYVFEKTDKYNELNEFCYGVKLADSKEKSKYIRHKIFALILYLLAPSAIALLIFLMIGRLLFSIEIAIAVIVILLRNCSCIYN